MSHIYDSHVRSYEILIGINMMRHNYDSLKISYWMNSISLLNVPKANNLTVKGLNLFVHYEFCNMTHYVSHSL